MQIFKIGFKFLAYILFEHGVGLVLYKSNDECFIGHDVDRIWGCCDILFSGHVQPVNVGPGAARF